jgi:hypothetical protein
MSRRRLDLTDAQIRALFDAQDPVARLGQGELADAILPVETIFGLEPRGARATRIPRLSLRRRIALIAIAILVLAVLTAAAWFYLESRSPSVPMGARCYSFLSSDAPNESVGIPVGSTAEAACVDQWDFLWHTPPPPHLVTCIMQPGGMSGVLPNPDQLDPTDACRLVGGLLVAQSPSYQGLSPDQVRVLDDRAAAAAHELREQGCVGALDLAAKIQGVLDSLGASGWTLEDQATPTVAWVFPDGVHATVDAVRNPSGQICADYAIYSRESRVVIVNGWPDFPVEPSASPSP